MGGRGGKKKKKKGGKSDMHSDFIHFAFISASEFNELAEHKAAQKFRISKELRRGRMKNGKYEIHYHWRGEIGGFITEINPGDWEKKLWIVQELWMSGIPITTMEWV